MVTQAWKTDRLDLADHFLSKLEQVPGLCQVDDALDLCYGIGIQQLESGNIALARQWLKKASTIYDALESSTMTWELKDSYTNLMHAYGSNRRTLFLWEPLLSRASQVITRERRPRCHCRGCHDCRVPAQRWFNTPFALQTLTLFFAGVR